MKEFLEKFGLSEVLTYFFPGFLALCAALVWAVPQPAAFLGPDLSQNEFLLGALLLISAYAVGLVLNMWGLHGSQAATQTVPWPGGTWTQRLKYFGSWLRWRYVVVSAGMRPLVPAAMLGMLEIQRLLRGVYGAASMPLLLYPTTQLTVFRGALCERIKEKVEVMLAEPEVERRRYVFAIGVALAMIVLAFSAFTRLAVAMVARIPAVVLRSSASWRSAAPLILLAPLGVVAAFSAAHVARTWKWTAAFLFAAVVLCVGAPVATAIRPTWLPLAPSQAALPGVVVLAAVSVTVCFLLKRDLRSARVLLSLFIGSGVCLAAIAVANLPFEWVANLTRWDAQNPRQPLLLIAIVLVSYRVSRSLRKVAIQCLEREVAHTLAIVRLFGHFF